MAVQLHRDPGDSKMSRATVSCGLGGPRNQQMFVMTGRPFKAWQFLSVCSIL